MARETEQVANPDFEPFTYLTVPELAPYGRVMEAFTQTKRKTCSATAPSIGAGSHGDRHSGQMRIRPRLFDLIAYRDAAASHPPLR